MREGRRGWERGMRGAGRRAAWGVEGAEGRLRGGRRGPLGGARRTSAAWPRRSPSGGGLGRWLPRLRLHAFGRGEALRHGRVIVRAGGRTPRGVERNELCGGMETTGGDICSARP